MDVGVLCTECKDNVVKPDKLNYTMSSNFPPLRASMEAGAVLNQEVVKQISARLQAQREFYESPIGRGLACKNCKRDFTRTEDRWQPRCGEDCYRVMSLDDADANRERVRAENAKTKFYGKTYFESQR